MILIKLIVFFFLVGVVAILFIALSVLFGLNSVMKSFRKTTGSTSRRRTTTFRQRKNNDVIDNRDPKKANQKIFDKHDGEYVDYTDE